MLRFLFFIFLSGLVCSAPMFAQNSGAVSEDDGDYLDYGAAEDELVITASRVPEDAASVPARLTVITAEDIAESGALSVVDVLATVPGVRFSGGMSGPGSEAVSMRGFGENASGRVLVLVDGRKVNNPDMSVSNWNAIPLANIERIEVLDGSASVRYGNNAAGGVINIITRKGGERLTVLEIAGGSFIFNKFSAAHFEPARWGNFSLSAEHTGTDGYRERQGAQTTNLTGGAGVFLSDTLRLDIRVAFADLYYRLPGGLTKEEFDHDPAQAVNYNDENTERHFGGDVGLQWVPGGILEISLPLSYTGKFIKSDMVSYPSFTERNTNTFEARPQAVANTALAGMPLRLLAGLDFYLASQDVESYADKERKTKSAGSSATASEWTLGPYLTARFDPLSRLSLSAGLRFDTARIAAKTEDGSVDEGRQSGAFVYDAGAAFNPIPGLKLYAKYSSLFRYPFIDEQAQYSGYENKFNLDLEPEKGFNAEAGLAYRLGKIARLDAGFFFMRLEDEIAYDNEAYANVNMDKTRRIGVNIGLSAAPVDLLSVELSYSYVDAVFVDGVNKDKHVPLVPAHKFYANIMVNLPVGLSFGPDFEFASGCYYGQDVANAADPMDAWFLLGARARFALDRDGGRFSLQVSAKNLLDTHTAVYGTTYFDSYVTNAWVYTLYPVDGRSVNVSLRYRL
ncbi:MAG: TonB-dependent receptor [Spirochaetaceae bacterium]|jgi:iron complex outermembrane receptor protein|nr:TonB-dependent receptor [Spirochaetaceae bacterium]